MYSNRGIQRVEEDDEAAIDTLSQQQQEQDANENDGKTEDEEDNENIRTNKNEGKTVDEEAPDNHNENIRKNNQQDPDKEEEASDEAIPPEDTLGSMEMLKRLIKTSKKKTQMMIKHLKKMKIMIMSNNSDIFVT